MSSESCHLQRELSNALSTHTVRYGLSEMMALKYTFHILKASFPDVIREWHWHKYTQSRDVPKWERSLLTSELFCALSSVSCASEICFLLYSVVKISSSVKATVIINGVNNPKFKSPSLFLSARFVRANTMIKIYKTFILVNFVLKSKNNKANVPY